MDFASHLCAGIKRILSIPPHWAVYCWTADGGLKRRRKKKSSANATLESLVYTRYTNTLSYTFTPISSRFILLIFPHKKLRSTEKNQQSS